MPSPASPALASPAPSSAAPSPGGVSAPSSDSSPTTIRTLSPSRSSMLASGDCASTRLMSFGFCAGSKSISTSNPLATSCWRAVSGSNPITDGTATSGMPVDWKMVTVSRPRKSEPASGSVRMTRPSSMDSLGSSTIAIRKSRSAISSSAFWNSAPTRSGTVRSDGPRETSRKTTEPRSEDTPAAGSWRITTPAGTLLLSTSTTFAVKPRRPSCSSASPRVRSTSVGTSSWPSA